MTLKTVNKNNPCPICGKPDQCSKSEDGGLVCCWRLSDPVDGWSIRKKNQTSSDGRNYTTYIQGVDYHPDWDNEPPETNEIHARVYQSLLGKLPCDLDDIKHLADRGIKNYKNYGTMIYQNAVIRGEIAKDLLDEFGDVIYTVPGISKNCPSDIGKKPWLEGAEGLMIPVRDYFGRIKAVMLRPRSGEGSKYIFLSSSSKPDGIKATPALHFPVKFRENRQDGKPIFITEGPLKSEVLSDVHGMAVVGTSNNSVLLAYWFISHNPFETFILAYDQDSKEQARKTTSLNLLKTFHKFPQYDIRLAVWDGAKGKGMDDLLNQKGTYDVLGRKEALAYLSQYASLEDDRIEEEEKEYYRTEWSEALSLKAKFGGDIAYVQEWDDFLVWNGTIWQQDSYGPAILYKRHLDERLNEYLKKVNSTREDAMKHPGIKWLMGGHKLNRMNNVVNHLKSESDMRKRVMNIPVVRNVITCPNGTIDLTTGELRKNKRSDWQQSFCPTKFNPDAKCARWMKLLHDVFLGSTDLIHYVQKLFGMSITGQPCDHVFPVFCGDGRNGKSTILGTIQQVLGSGLAGAVDSNHLCKGNDRHPTWLASFHGKRLMIAQETARGAELNVALVKQLTGGDHITCRRMRENEWSFLPTHTLILCTNEKPNIPESNAAIWSRITVVPFRASFSLENGNLDTSLPVKIMQEAEGILNWLVQGALMYQKEGLEKPAEVVGLIQEYREINDPEQSVINWLAQFSWPKKTDKDDLADMKSVELHRYYASWCLDNAVRPLGTKNFSIALSKENRNLMSRMLDGSKFFRPKPKKF